MDTLISYVTNYLSGICPFLIASCPGFGFGLKTVWFLKSDFCSVMMSNMTTIFGI